jgi:hypothetical protein
MLTIAVKETNCPDTDGFGEELSTKLVAALLTVWVSVAVLLGKLLLPL